MPKIIYLDRGNKYHEGQDDSKIREYKEEKLVGEV